MNWRAAFHPNDPITGSDLYSVVCELEGNGLKVETDSLGRITSVRETSGNDLLYGFFPPTDDPARFLPSWVVRGLDSAFPDRPGGEYGGGFLTGFS